MLISHVFLFDNCRVIKTTIDIERKTKSIGLTNVKVSILFDYALQHFSRGWKKTSIFYEKKLFNAGTEMMRGYPNPSRTGFNFSSPLGMGRVTCKYMRIRYGDRKYKIHPHPAPLSCLTSTIKSFARRHIL